MTPMPSHERALPPGNMTLSAVIDVAFYALITTSAARYLLSHGVSERWYWVLGLAILLAAAYLSMRWLPAPLLWAGPVLCLVCWVPLVVLAPSFWWCAFSLLFIARERLPLFAAVPAILLITGLTGWSLLTLAGTFDWLIVVGVVVVAALLTTAFAQVAGNRARLMGAIEHLTTTQGQLAEAERHAGTLEERERLSAELHDSVAQGLTTVLLMMEASAQSWTTAPETAKKSLDIAADSARMTLAETRNMVHQLASPRLEGVTLAGALTQLAAELPGGSFELTGEPEQIEEHTAHALLRVAQSAAENVRRHAAAANTRITLSFLTGQLSLDVVDDGIGFNISDLPAPSDRGGYGLRAMRARVEAQGGTLAIESHPGEGTAVSAHIPTPAQAGETA